MATNPAIGMIMGVKQNLLFAGDGLLCPGCSCTLGDPNQAPPLLITMGGFVCFAFHFICTAGPPCPSGRCSQPRQGPSMLL